MTDNIRSLELWLSAKGLIEKRPTAMAEATEYWNEIPTIFSGPVADTNIAHELRVEFAVGQASHFLLLKQAATLLIFLLTGKSAGVKIDQ